MSEANHDRSLAGSQSFGFNWFWAVFVFICLVAGFYRWFWVELVVRLNFPFIETAAHLLMIAIVIVTIVIYLRRQKQVLSGITLYTCWPALMLVWAGLFTYILGGGGLLFVYGSSLIHDVGIIMCLLGLITTLSGWACMRVFWLPLLMVSLVIIRLPYVWIDFFFPLLQQVTNWIVVFLFSILNLIVDTGIEIDGSQILVSSGGYGSVPLNFAEASLKLERLPLYLAIGFATAFLFYRWWLQRLVIILLALPLGVILNSVYLVVHVLYFENLSSAFHATFPFLLFELSCLLFVVGLLFVLLMGWGWVWQFAVIQTEDHAKQSEDIATGQRSLVEYTGIPMRPSLLGLVAGFGTSVLALGFIYWIVTATVGMLSQTQHLYLVLSLLLVLPVAMQLILLRVPVIKPRLSVVAIPVLAGVLMANVVCTQLFSTHSRSMRVKAHTAQLARMLDTIPLRVDGWTMLNQSPRLSRDVEEELGTTMYLMRDYQKTQTNEVLQLDIRYYPGDAVAFIHDIDQIMRVGGLFVVGKESPVPIPLEGDWQPDTARGNSLKGGARDKPWLASLGPDSETSRDLDSLARIHSKDVPVTITSFSNPSRSNGRLIHVVTFYITKNTYLATSDDVMWAMLQHRNVSGRYYCQVQITMSGIDSREEVERVTADFLSEMLPYIMSCLPGCEKQSAGDASD